MEEFFDDVFDGMVVWNCKDVFLFKIWTLLRRLKGLCEKEEIRMSKPEGLGRGDSMWEVLVYEGDIIKSLNF